MSETWKPVVGFEGLYEVSDHGRVRSVERVATRSNGRKMPVPAKVLTAVPNERGRPRVHLKKDGKSYSRNVHKLVLEAFVGLPEPGEQCCHWDDDPLNNHLSNLRWGTRLENEQDRLRNGKNANANKTHCPQGHEYTEDNIYRQPARPNVRFCKACRSEKDRKRYLAKKSRKGM